MKVAGFNKEVGYVMRPRVGNVGKHMHIFYSFIPSINCGNKCQLQRHRCSLVNNMPMFISNWNARLTKKKYRWLYTQVVWRRKIQVELYTEKLKGGGKV